MTQPKAFDDHMDAQLDKLRMEVQLARNQRDVDNAYHTNKVKTLRQKQQHLSSKIQRCSKRGILPHHARAALTTGGKNELPTSLYIVQLQCTLVATLRQVEVMEHAVELLQSQGDIMKRFMLCEMTALDNEKLDCKEGYCKQRAALVQETRRIEDSQQKAIRRRRSLLRQLDPKGKCAHQSMFTTLFNATPNALWVL